MPCNSSWTNRPGSRWTISRYLSLLSVYLPTVKARPNVKTKFADDFQHVLDTLPAGDIMKVQSDFNAWIGRRESEYDVWQKVWGLHGIGICNEACEQLLELCAINNECKEKFAILQSIGIIAIKSSEIRAVIYTCRYFSGQFNP